MHISEGVLSAPVLIAGGALSCGGLWIGVRRLHEGQIVNAAALASVFFVASLVHIPIGPASAHLLLIGLVGISLGWAAFPCIFIGLVLQAVLFQFGGLTVLGVNTFIMAAPAVLVHYLSRGFIRRGGRWTSASAFLAGAGAIAGSAVLAAAALISTDEGFLTLTGLILAAHIPVLVVEGLITGTVISYLLRVRPALVCGRGLYAPADTWGDNSTGSPTEVEK